MELPGQVPQGIDAEGRASSTLRPEHVVSRAMPKFAEEPAARISQGYFVDDGRFHVGLAFVIIVNAITIGLETDYGCKNICSVEQRGVWFVMDAMFTGIFALEMVMRFYAHGFLGYFRLTHVDTTRGPPGCTVESGWASTWRDPWNRFDFVLVNLAILDTGVMSHIKSGHINLKLLTVLRIARIFRLVRLVRLVRAFHELRLIVAGMVQAFRGLIWVTFIMTTLLWCLAIFMTILVGQDDDPTGYDYRSVPWPREVYWGTVPGSMFSLCQLLTYDNWVSSLARPVLVKYPLMIIFFVGTICVCTYGLLNIIVSIIVESTLSITERNDRKVARMIEKSHKRSVNALNSIFQASDKDGTGTMDRKQFSSTMKKRHVKDKLSMIGIRPTEMRDLYTLLDSDGGGNVSIDEFQQGCMLIRGEAKSKEMVKLSMHVTAYKMHLNELCLDVEEQNSVLENVLNRLWRTEKEFRDAALVEPKVKKTKKRGFRKTLFKASDENTCYDGDVREPEAEPTHLNGEEIPEPPPLPPSVAGTTPRRIPTQPAANH